MSGPTKMIIITSNEDLIRQISSNNSSNTRMIELDDNKYTSSISDEKDNYVDLTLLAQLSELNSKNDQVYKRVLDSPKQLRTKLNKVSKKGVDLVCVVCGDHAIGFNYDALTCASCKAFFRRNARYNPDQIRCLTGQRKCVINNDTNRKCQRCRLEKCLKVGMRKDFILSEEDKQKRQKRLEENRHLTSEHQSSTEVHSLSPINKYLLESASEIDRMLMEIDNNNENMFSEKIIESNNIENESSSTISSEDWNDIQMVLSSYSISVEIPNTCYPSLDATDQISALATWSEAVSQTAFKLINYFRRIDEFESLNGDDRFTLIKYNLYPICFLQKCLHFNPLTRSFGNIPHEDMVKRGRFFRLCYGASGIREKFMSLMQSLSYVTEQDRILINLLILVLLFSKGLSMSEDEPSLKYILAVDRAQNHYIRLIWNYLVSKHGQEKTIKQFTQLLSEISKIQWLTKFTRDFFRKEIQSEEMLERIAPLMQSVLNLA